MRACTGRVFVRGREQTEKVQDLEARQGFKREYLKCYIRGKITIRNV